MKENTEVFDDCLVVQYSDLKASFSTSFFLLFCNIIIIAVYSLFLKNSSGDNWVPESYKP